MGVGWANLWTVSVGSWDKTTRTGASRRNELFCLVLNSEMSYIQLMSRTAGYVIAVGASALLCGSLSAATAQTNAVQTKAAAPASGPGGMTAVQPEDPQASGASDAAPAEAQLAPNPYQGIITRNPFGLKPPPPPATNEQPQAQVTPSALKLTGLTTLLSTKRAMFVLQEPGKQPVNSDLVREGEKDSYITNLEVLQIDEKAGVVQVKYGGKELALNFTDNGLKPAVGPPAATGSATPGAPGSPGAPGAPGRAVPPVSIQAGVAYAGPAAAAMQASSSGLRSIPTRPNRLGGANSANAALQASQPQMSPEEQIIAMKVQELHAQRKGISLPPMPPIPGLDSPAPPVPGQ